tara:strand:+ start:202 stop:831 length:630 start_codon:yes stop_codon:yes gene_type:complete
MNKIKALLFDLDGVLVEAKEWHYEALNSALSNFGYGISRYDHLVSFDGLPTRKKLEMLSIDNGLPFGLHAFINKLKQDITLKIIYKNCKPVFHHQYALSKFASSGLKICVCTNSVNVTAELMLRKADLLQYLEFFLTNEDVETAKPDPEIYTTAINRLELKPTDCLIIEDNENGIKAARASGAYVLQVADTNQVTHSRILQEINGIENG